METIDKFRGEHMKEGGVWARKLTTATKKGRPPSFEEG